MTDHQIRHLLEAIKTIALAPYPWTPGSESNDDRLVMALGEIAGLAMKALDETKPADHRS